MTKQALAARYAIAGMFSVREFTEAGDIRTARNVQPLIPSTISALQLLPPNFQ
jgi:hypothetical protein